MPHTRSATGGPANRDHQVHLQATGGIFDFRLTHDFARNYLRTFYAGEPTNDERVVLPFLVRHYPCLPQGSTLLEIGCGPTIHHLLPACPYVSEIHMADYLPENLEQVRKWQRGDDDAHDWRRFTALVLEYEGRAATSRRVAERESLLRRQMTAFLPCDLKCDDPLGKPTVYDAVGAFYCAEEVGISLPEWRKVMARIAALVKPGGHLFLASLAATDFYSVVSPDGIRVHYPAAYVTEDDYRAVLSALSFPREQTVLETQRIQGQVEEGVTGVILLSARKAAPEHGACSPDRSV